MDPLDPDREDALDEVEAVTPEASPTGELELFIQTKNGQKLGLCVPPGYGKKFVQALQEKADDTENPDRLFHDAFADDELQTLERLNRMRQGLTKNIRSHYQMLSVGNKTKARIHGVSDRFVGSGNLAGAWGFLLTRSYG